MSPQVSNPILKALGYGLVILTFLAGYTTSRMTQADPRVCETNHPGQLNKMPASPMKAIDNE